MSTRELARLGLALLGAYLIVEGLVHATASLTDRPFLILKNSPTNAQLANSMLTSAALGLLGATIFSIIPGIVLISKSEAWARSWFPETASAAEPDRELLFPVGMIVLGLYFGVTGIAGIVAGITQILVAEESSYRSEYGWKEFGASSVYLAAGLVLFACGARKRSDAA